MLSIKVVYKGKEVGIVSENDNNPNYYVFRYSDDFIKDGIELCPILMPLSKRNYLFNNLAINSFKGLPPLLADSLPDKYGSELLFSYQKIFNKERLSPLEVLSYIGKKGMGALEFVPAIDEIGMDKEQIIEIDKLSIVANQILNEKEKIAFNVNNIALKQLISIGSSIGGARAKAVIAIDKKGNIKSGQIAGLKNHEYCIIKFDGLSSDLNEEKNITYYTRIEYAYYLMAADAGITINTSELLEINGKYHFKTKRFDRDDDGNKIHMLSLAGLLGFDYMKAGEYSYEDVANAIKELECDADDLYQLFKRMVFNVVCRNQDDHVKNISFIMNDDGKYKLSPAYDLSYSYNPHGDWTKYHQMSINNKVDKISYDDLLESGINMGIKKNKVISLIEDVMNVAKHFNDYAKKAKIPEEIIKKIYSDFCIIND